MKLLILSAVLVLVAVTQGKPFGGSQFGNQGFQSGGGGFHNSGFGHGGSSGGFNQGHQTSNFHQVTSAQHSSGHNVGGGSTFGSGGHQAGGFGGFQGGGSQFGTQFLPGFGR